MQGYELLECKARLVFVSSSKGITFDVSIRDEVLVMLGFYEDDVVIGVGDASCSSLIFGILVHALTCKVLTVIKMCNA